MASAVVTSVSGKLGNLLIQETKLLFEVKHHFKWIQEELRWMQRFLKDADYKQNEEERVKIWVEDIIQVSYDAEDVIDTFIYSQNAPRRRRGFAEWVSRGVCIVGELITQYMVSKKIEKIKERIRDIKERRETYGIRDIDEGRQGVSSSTSSPQEHWQFYSDVKELEVVGQEAEMNILREQLISEDPTRCVISIAGMPGSGHPTLRMRLLDDVKGWELFMKRIFPKEKNPTTACPEMGKGKEILAKCGGLPLAILVASGLLSREPENPKVWFDVHASVERHYLTESSNKCGRILYLGYSQLPYYLKPCFLYLGLLPEDYEISSGRLIRLWIAEGFIQPRNNAILEDIGEEYLNELVGRSMIQVISRKSNGSVGKCCIHDLLRDLSISEARQNNFFTIDNDKGMH